MRFLLPFFAALFFFPPAFAQNWTIDADKSRVSFEAMQMGAPFEGDFAAPAGSIVFDPGKLGEASAVIEIDVTSVKTGNGERDGNILKPEWLDAGQFPKAVFKSTGFEKAEGEGNYSVTGELTIRDITLPVTMPFTFKTEGDTATAEGRFDINRLDFGIGQGEWKDTAMIGGSVMVKVSIAANKTP